MGGLGSGGSRPGSGRKPAVPANLSMPFSIEAEMCVIGSAVIESEAAEKAAETLTSDDFYRKDYGALFDLVVELSRQTGAKAVDLVMVMDAVKAKGLQETLTLPHIASCIDATPTAANVEHYAKIVKGDSTRRKLILRLYEGIVKAQGHTEDADTLVQDVQASISGVESPGKSALVHISEPLDRVMHDAEDATFRDGAMTGLSTGIEAVDAITGGWQKQNLIIVAARPGIGKSAMAAGQAEHCVMVEKQPTAFFSQEMSQEEIATRLICGRACVDSRAFRRGMLTKNEWSRIDDVTALFKETPLYVRDTSNLTVQEIRNDCKQMHRTVGLGLVIVDYLQLMRSQYRTKDGNRNQELDEIAGGLKSIAKEFNVPVIALSQLSREVDKRPGHRAVLSDVRDSGGIEATADIIVFPFRQSYYDQISSSPEAREKDWMEEAELAFAKHRNGPTGVVKVGFVARFAKFCEWSQ